jgi:hypothetical protein
MDRNIKQSALHKPHPPMEQSDLKLSVCKNLNFLMKMKNTCPGFDGIPVKIRKSFSKHTKGMGMLMDNLIK